MRLTWGHLLAGLALACAWGCGSASEPTISDEPYQGPVIDAEIGFDHQGTLTLAPGEAVDLLVSTDPPQRYAISFYLLGNALDASLNSVSVVADPNGHASVTLRAPNGATSFVVRATIKDGPSAELPVSVSALGFGSLDVQPSYNGKRSVEAWRAFVVSGTTCSALSESFPNDPEGALTASAEPGYPLVVKDAPVGPNLVVFVRGERYVWGCTDEPALTAGETKPVVVKIVNKPVITDSADLDVDMTMTPEVAPWQTLVAQQKALMMNAFFEQQSPASILLAEMSALSTDPAAFDFASQQNNWLQQLNSHLSANAVDIMTAMDGWLAAGLASQPAEIKGHAIGLESGHALFTLTSYAGFAPAEIGSPESHLMTLTADPDDTVRLGGAFLWQPSLFFGRTIEKRAVAETQLLSFDAVLADLVACDQLNLPGFNGCDMTCMQALCSDALASRWQHALDASADSLSWAEVPFEASGPSELDVEALLKGFAGSWLGNVLVGVSSAKVTGEISAITPAPPAG